MIGGARGLVDGDRRILLTFGARRLGNPAPEFRTETESSEDFDRPERTLEVATGAELPEDG